MKLEVLNLNETVSRQLCCGCGACAGMAPERIEMVDAIDHGRRPRYRDAQADLHNEVLPRSLCPGRELDCRETVANNSIDTRIARDWGPVLEVWEGHATDEEVRFAASSGGAATALALWCIERGGMHGVLHIRARKDAPVLNESTISTTRDEMLAATGSRYAPASPCDLLHRVAMAPAPCVMVGKPCDVAAARSACQSDAKLHSKIGLTIAIFCAGTPTTRATVRLLEHLGIQDPSDVIDIRYRGHGWPGETVVRVRTAEGEQTHSLTYEQAWGDILAHDKQWRCHVCPDHTGEFADIAVGDPWYRSIQPGEAGESLVVVRTERGGEIIRRAMASGALSLRRVDSTVLASSQPSLLRARAATWGRVLACRLLGVPAPRYRGMSLFGCWLSHGSVLGKLRSVVGTMRRILARRLQSPATLWANADAVSANFQTQVGASDHSAAGHHIATIDLKPTGALVNPRQALTLAHVEETTHVQ